MHINVVSMEARKKALDPLELESRADVSHLMCVLRWELNSGPLKGP